MELVQEPEFRGIFVELTQLGETPFGVLTLEEKRPSRRSPRQKISFCCVFDEALNCVTLLFGDRLNAVGKPLVVTKNDAGFVNSLSPEPVY